MLTINLREECSKSEVLNDLLRLKKECSLGYDDCPLSAAFHHRGTSALCDWIAENMYGLKKYKIHSVYEFAPTPEIGKYISCLEDGIAAMETLRHALSTDKSFVRDESAYLSAVHKALRSLPIGHPLEEKLISSLQNDSNSDGLAKIEVNAPLREELYKELQVAQEHNRKEIEDVIVQSKKYGNRSRLYRRAKATAI